MIKISRSYPHLLITLVQYLVADNPRPKKSHYQNKRIGNKTYTRNLNPICLHSRITDIILLISIMSSICGFP